MQPLDAPTLLMVSVVFNCFGALVWAMLALLFRLAPRAAWLVAGAHLSLVPVLLPLPPTPWSGWWADAFKLLASALLALGVRQLMRLSQTRSDIIAIVALTALLLLWQALHGEGGASLVPTSVALTLLAMIAFRDVLIGAAPGFSTLVTSLMSAPFAALAGINALRVLAAWGLLGDGGAVLLHTRQQSALLAALWLLLCLCISVGLVALLLHRLIVRTEHLTRTDTLTGALNRRALMERLAELQAQVRRGRPLSLLMVDVDHFKRVNDSLGHAAGDAALMHLTELLRQGIRDVDVLGRMGGEEFCVLLPDTPLTAALEVAERLRARLQANPFVWQGHSLSLTASFGLAAGNGDDAGGRVGLGLADTQLYQAKAQGRNRVCAAQA